MERRFFRVGKFPAYSSVVEVENPNSIDPTEPYRFILAGLNPRSKMTVIKLQKVKSFDHLMWELAFLK